MALQLPELIVDASPITDGLTLPVLVVDASPIAEGIRLPRLSLTEAAELDFTIVGAGSTLLSGSAGRYFFLNGEEVSDSNIYTISTSGGLSISGAAPHEARSPVVHNIIGLGGASASGSAPFEFSFTAFTGSGGANLYGEAEVEFIELLADLVVSTPAMRVTMTGEVNTEARLRLPALHAAATAVVGVTGNMTASFGALNTSSEGTVGLIADVSLAVPAIQANASAVAGLVANASMNLATPRLALTAVVGVIGNLRASLSAPIAELAALVELTQVMTLVMNTRTTALSEYDAYAFNSFAVIDGKYYAAGPDGLFRIDVGDVDEADTANEIQASFMFGANKLGSAGIKRVSDCYAAMRASGEMKFRLHVDEQDPVEYAINPLAIDRLKQRRSLVGKGARGKYWQLQFENTNGCDFDFDSITMQGVDTGRGV